jgi:hypothetical protein
MQGVEEFCRHRVEDPGFLDSLSDNSGNLVEFSSPSATMGIDARAELQILFDRLVTLDRRGKKERRALDKRQVRAKVARCFEESNIRVATNYRLQGRLSPYVFDFVRDEDQLQAFECFALGTGANSTVDEAKVLVYSINDIVRRAEELEERRIAGLDVTALVHSTDPKAEEVVEAKEILSERASVREVDSTLAEFIQSLAARGGLA